MSIINQMLKDLEDRKESAIKGQNSIISRSRSGAQSSRLPIILLSLLSVILLAAVIYLIWNIRSDIASRQPIVSAAPVVTKQKSASTIASLVKESNHSTSIVEPSSVVITPQRVITPSPPAASRSRDETPAAATKASPVLVSEVAPPQAHPEISISRLIPSELRGNWAPQKLTIMGQSFLPDSEVLVCWPVKCVTLKGYRVNFISPNELNITLTTGIKEERWHLTVINPNGEASNAKEFVVSSTPSAATPAPLETIAADSTTENSSDYADDDIEKASKRIIPLTVFQQAEEYYLEANRLERAHKNAQALLLWEKAVLLAPEHHASRQALVDRLIDSARTVEAEGHIKQAIKLFPNHPIYIQKLAQIRLTQGEVPAAIALIEDSIQQGVTNAELYAFVAALYQREKSYHKSIEHYQRALTLKAQSGIWWMGLGISFAQNGQDSEALSAFKQAQNSGTLSHKLMAYVDEQIIQLNKRISAGKPN